MNDEEIGSVSKPFSTERKLYFACVETPFTEIERRKLNKQISDVFVFIFIPHNIFQRDNKTIECSKLVILQ